MFEVIFLTVLILYILQLSLFITGLMNKYPRLKDEDLPSISIIVAARNEENNIERCMQALSELIYPEDKMEVIIVNDNSTDKTGEIINYFVMGRKNFKTILAKKEIGDLKGKANALANGIEICKGEVVLTTDADCAVSKTWAKTIASYYVGDVAMVQGFTNQENKSPFGGMQAIDFIYLLSVASGSTNLGIPLSCIGNNMSYRKSAYKEVGGYESIPFSVTEDFNLLRAINKSKKNKIIYPVNSGSVVTSLPCPNFRVLYWQKKRWAVGGLESEWKGFFVMAIGFSMHLVMLASLFFLSATTAAWFAAKVMMDYAYMKLVHGKLNLKFKFGHFLLFELYFILYVLILPFTLLPGTKIKWKGREF